MSWRQAASNRQAPIASTARAGRSSQGGHDPTAQLRTLLPDAGSRGTAACCHASNRGSAASMHRKKRSRRGARERRHVEHRVVRLRQLVERPHADEAGQRRAEHRRLEGDRDELRPAVERPAADVHRIGDRPTPSTARPKPPSPPTMPPSSTSSGSRVRLQPERLVQLLDRNRRVGVHLPVAGQRAPWSPRRPAPPGLSNSAIRP